MDLKKLIFQMGAGQGGSTFVGPYDAYSGIQAAYGVRRLRKNYAGDCLLLRRSSDNAELAFGFTASGDLDVNAIATWLGGSNGYVKTWYDQSGNSLDIVQTTAGSQPLYVATGINTAKPCICLDGLDDCLTKADAALAMTGMTAVAVLALQTLVANDGIYSMVATGGADWNSADGFAFHQTSTGYKLLHDYSGTNKLEISVAQNAAEFFLSVVTFGGGNGLIRKNGVEVGTDTYGTVAAIDANVISVGGRISPALEKFGQNDVGELVFFSPDLDATAIAAIETEVEAYFGNFT